MAQIFLTTNLVIDEYLFSGYGDSLCLKLALTYGNCYRG